MWDKIPALRILLPFLSGIVIALEFPQTISSAIIVFWLLFFSLLLFAVYKKLHLSHKLITLRGFVLQIVLFTAGIYIIEIKDPTTHKAYFANYITDTSLAQVRVLLPPEEKDKTIKLLVDVESISNGDETIKCFGKSLIYIKKDSLTQQEFSYGDILLVKNNFQKPATAKNPNEFEYDKYLISQGIYYTAFFNKSEYVSTGTKKVNKAWQIIFNCRLYFENLLKENIHDPDAYVVSSALLLGVRSTISADIVQAYANTGTMHILSVSGLHVGIFYLILEFLLGFIPYFKSDKSSRKYSKAFIITFVIWFYACITGLCPSVARSAVMFTFLIFGKLNRKHVNSYNVLAASAIPLLIINPFMLTQVGFQLSYLAILGIITFQPVITKLYQPKRKISAYIWSLINVSIAAQLGTIPITIYYFHQFPNYFLLSNILAIPLSFLVLVAGVLFFTLSFISSINHITGWMLEFLLKALNYAVVQANNLPGSLLNNLYLSPYQVIIFYLIFIFLALFIYSKNKNFFSYTVMSFCFLCFSIGVKKYYQMQQNEISVYSLPGSFLIAKTQGLSAELYSHEHLSDTSAAFRYHVKADLLAKGIHKYEFITIGDTSASHQVANYFLIDTILFCYLDEKTNLPSVELPAVNTVIIGGNTRLKPADVKNIFPDGDFILAQTQNTNLKSWREYCLDNYINYHDLKNDGYAHLNY